MSRSSWMTRFAPTVPGRPGHRAARVGGSFWDWLGGVERIPLHGELAPHGSSVQAVHNAYMRTHAETMILEPNPAVVVVQDNLMTAANGWRLLDIMKVQANDAREGILSQQFNIIVPQVLEEYSAQLAEFEARMDFYAEVLDSVPPETRLGDQTEAGALFYQQFVEPVMFGWFPNDSSPYTNPTYQGVLQPFADQGEPYSSQTGRVVPDFVTGRTILLELGAVESAYDHAFNQLVDELVKAYTEAADDAVQTLKIGAGVGLVVGAIVLANMVKR